VSSADVLNVNVKVSKQHLEVSQEQLDITKSQHYQAETRYQNETHRNCHLSFKICEYHEYKDTNPGREAGTCQWVLNHPQYLEWRKNSQDDLLWISADPGGGKSVLTRSLVDTDLQSNSPHTICYFFFKDNENQNGLVTAFCTILHQLFSEQPHLLRHAMTEWEKDGEQLKQEVSKLWNIFLVAAMDPGSHDVTCVFDALDEVRDRDRERLINMLTAFYSDRYTTSKDRRCRLKFLVTSRPYDDIQDYFHKISKNVPGIRLRGEDESDKIGQEINIVIKSRVAELAARRDLRPNIQQRLEEALLNIEHRTYLWLYLAMDSINEGYRTSLRPDQYLIDFLPSSVEDAY